MGVGVGVVGGGDGGKSTPTDYSADGDQWPAGPNRQMGLGPQLGQGTGGGGW